MQPNEIFEKCSLHKLVVGRVDLVTRYLESEVTTISDLSPIVSNFIFKNIRSVWQLELLLHIRTLAVSQELDGPSVASLAKALYMNPEVILGGLMHFEQCGLVERLSPDVYVYSPASRELEEAVRLTAQTYSSRRVAVVNLIFSQSAKTQPSEP